MAKGYVSDDGNLMNPDPIELPGLCKKCKKNDDLNEKVLCNLNRIDQKQDIESGKDFQCYAYEPVK